MNDASKEPLKSTSWIGRPMIRSRSCPMNWNAARLARRMRPWEQSKTSPSDAPSTMASSSSASPESPPPDDQGRSDRSKPFNFPEPFSNSSISKSSQVHDAGQSGPDLAQAEDRGPRAAARGPRSSACARSGPDWPASCTCELFEMEELLNGSGKLNGFDRSERPWSSGGGLSGDAELLEAMVDGASEGLVLLCSHGLILRANRAAFQFIGHDRDRIIGRPIQEVLFKGSFEASFIAEIVASPLAVSRAYDLADGRSILVQGRPVVAGAARVVLVISDVTSVKQLVNLVQGPEGDAKATWAEMRCAEKTLPDGAPVVVRSVAMQAVRDKALQCATVDSPVLLLGETGTGKGVFAKLIHEASARRSGPFHVVNCGAIPEGLLEAELFGYARGAFTGADSRGQVGLIELAHTGTLLLDEIGDLPLGLQVKLLRFLESGEVWPVGASKSKRPDVRIVAATNRDVREMVAEGSFRKDLYYRLNVLSIRIPPLREHPEDIPRLVAMMLDQLERRLGRRKGIV